MVRYASATSRMDAWEPGGNREISRATAMKVPQVQGKASESMCELMEVVLGEGLCGWEKLCTAQKTPGFDVFGTRDNGEV